MEKYKRITISGAAIIWSQIIAALCTNVFFGSELAYNVSHGIMFLGMAIMFYGMIKLV